VTAVLNFKEASYAEDSLFFRTVDERSAYRELRRIQEQFPDWKNLTIVPLAGVRVPGHTWEVDFLVCYQGRSGVLEIDGGSHHGRWAADRSRYRVLEDSGIAYVDNLATEDVANPRELRRFLQRYLHRLAAA
jgi:very-short-patch-repair endonuclease